MKKKIISLLILLLMTPIVLSFNFGTVPKNNYQSTIQGGSAQFTVLLWNLGNSSYQVDVELKTKLSGWEIIVRPQNFILEPTPVIEPPYDEGEYMSISGIGNVKTKPMRIFVKTPDYVEPGIYELILVAKAGNSEGQISIFQEREFKLILEVKNNPTIFERTYESLKLTGNKVVEKGNDLRNTMTGMFTQTGYNSLIVFILGLILISGVIVVVLVKYKQFNPRLVKNLYIII